LWNINRIEGASTILHRQSLRVAPVGLDAVRGFLRYLSGCDNDARDLPLGQMALDDETARPGLVDTAQLVPVGNKLVDRLVERLQVAPDVGEVPHLAVVALGGHRYVNGLLVDIHADKPDTLLHDLPPLHVALCRRSIRRLTHGLQEAGPLFNNSHDDSAPRSVMIALSISASQSVSMRLPDGNRAIVDIRKLSEYCLNPDSPRGRHKARAFASALGLTAADARTLRAKLLEVARTGEAQAGEVDVYGRRYTIDFQMETPTGTVTIRSGWIVLRGKKVPRLTTCFVKQRKR
jgi:hypothetical protein